MQTMLLATDPVSLGIHWTWIDTLVVVGYLVLTTWIGHALAGKQATMRDFFLGGNKLPWYAVAGSSIATEISAVTFISVPAVVFAPGGNFTYMQLGIIAGLISRLFVAFVLVPQYYKRLVYSPYDYMGNQLGGGVRGVMTALFSFGQVFAQASRVYLTASVLELILQAPLAQLQQSTGLQPLAASIILIGVFAVLWTVIGGIATVIWTDVILFGVFVVGGVAALSVVALEMGGLGPVLSTGWDAGKFQLWDLDLNFDPTKTFTIWTAIFGTTFGNIGAYGTDQLMAQRIFCCRDQREAKKAVIAGYAGQLVTALMLLVGVALFVYYKGAAAVGETRGAPLPMEQWQRPLTDAAAASVRGKPDNIFPMFILSPVVPPGLTGLMIAGIFAAAISSFDSILAALSQTSINGIYLPIRRRLLRRSEEEEQALHAGEDEASRREHRHVLRVSRGLVLFWAAVLCAVAFWVDSYRQKYGQQLLDIALSLSSWAGGSLLAAFLLAWLPLRINGRGLIWAAPLSTLCVTALRFHESGALLFYGVCATVLVGSWVLAAFLGDPQRRTARLLKTLVLAAGTLLLLSVARWGYFGLDAGGAPRVLAWTWWALFGGMVAFVFGYLLADPKPREAERG